MGSLLISLAHFYYDFILELKIVINQNRVTNLRDHFKKSLAHFYYDFILELKIVIKITST